MRLVRVVLRVLLWPFKVVGRILARVVMLFLSPVLKWVDRSPAIGQLITALSDIFAVQRGLLMIIGTGLVVLSLVMSGVIWIALVSTEQFDSSLYLMCIPSALLHIGVLVGFIGMMLVVPLGQGFKKD